MWIALNEQLKQATHCKDKGQDAKHPGRKGNAEIEDCDNQRVVFVTINYRVGILGFLATSALSKESKDKISGNYAIKDQIAALKWVNNNISKFGGDSSNVTIAGQSAGSRNVNTLIVSPMAKGLFKNAVTMSANAIDSKVETLAEKEAKNDPLFAGKTLKEMRAMTTDELLALQSTYSAGYVIDGKYITDQYVDVLKAGKGNDVNVISGMVARDTDLFGTFFKTQATTVAAYNTDAQTTFGDLADEYLAAYGVKADSDISGALTKAAFDNLLALQEYNAKARALNGKAKTYAYMFTHVMPGEKSEEYGAFHTADVPYWFNHFSKARASYWTKTDYSLGDKMSDYLVNFAKTGNPNGNKLPTWSSYNKKTNRFTYLDLGDKVSQKQLTKAQEKFWKAYYGKLLDL